MQADGGMYKPGSAIQNYETSIAIMCFAQARIKMAGIKSLIKAADHYVKSIQWGADGSIDAVGHQLRRRGYGRSKTRPDLSNTSFLLDALEAAGDESNDQAVKRALVFVSKCQNLKTKYNPTPLADKVSGRRILLHHAPMAGASMAGKSENGGLRSYGSMTYAGLEEHDLRRPDPDDERVKGRHRLDQEELRPEQQSRYADQTGLYYAYNTFSKAMDALGKDTFIDDKGVDHAWKAELLTELAKRQKEDGSWVNGTPQFQENDPKLVTGYVLLVFSQDQAVSETERREQIDIARGGSLRGFFVAPGTRGGQAIRGTMKL